MQTPQQHAELQPIEASQFVSTMVSKYTGNSLLRRLHIDLQACADDIQFHANPVLLEYAVDALMSNAIRFNVQKGTISFSVYKRAFGPQEKTVVEICDSGRGCDLSRLYAIAQRTLLCHEQATEERPAGTGLVLARSVAMLHGGELLLDAGFEGGLRARIVLPTLH